MKKYLIPLLCAAFFLVLMSLPAFAENIRCAQCGMSSDLASKYTSRVVQGDKTLYFCDIGDLLAYLNTKKEQISAACVKDFRTGRWIEAQKAYYVHDSKKFNSPMGWGFASFSDKKEAAEQGQIMDFDGARRAVR